MAEDTPGPWPLTPVLPAHAGGAGLTLDIQKLALPRESGQTQYPWVPETGSLTPLGWPMGPGAELFLLKAGGSSLWWEGESPQIPIPTCGWLPPTHRASVVAQMVKNLPAVRET